MNWKKTLTAGVAVASAAMALTACGSSDSSKSNGNGKLADIMCDRTEDAHDPQKLIGKELHSQAHDGIRQNTACYAEQKARKPACIHAAHDNTHQKYGSGLLAAEDEHSDERYHVCKTQLHALDGY